MVGNQKDLILENTGKMGSVQAGKECSSVTCAHQPQGHPAKTLQRFGAAPRSLAAGDILQLQRTMGNQAVLQMFRDVVQRQEEEELQAKFEPVQRQEEDELQAKFEPVQRQEDEDPLQGRFSTPPPAQLKEGPVQPTNKSGMPDQLKTGLENLSGLDMSDVRVHYNSPEPAQLSALAYTQGTDIHVAPGQERHLPHEGWHAVQQMQGRVQPTIQVAGAAVNDDSALEQEADVMGGRAVQMRNSACQECRSDNHRHAYKKDNRKRIIKYGVPGIPGIPLQLQKKQTPRLCHKVVQRHAFIGDKQVIESYEGIEKYYPKFMSETVPIDNPSGKVADYIGDSYFRRYENRQEFDDHTLGQPVDVGLLDHLALWYRLPFASGFFVLGEKHNVASYRRIIKESNQTGNVLGEGGTVPVLHYSKSKVTRRGKAGSRTLANATEHYMESIVAKTAYALASLRDDIKRETLRAQSTQAPKKSVGRKRKYLGAEDWLLSVSAKDPKIRRGNNRKPYFINSNKEIVYLKLTGNPLESNYNRGKTATKLLVKCNKELEKYQVNTKNQFGLEDDGVRKFQEMLDEIITIYRNYAKLDLKTKQTLHSGLLKNATRLADLLAKNEIEESTISRGGLQGQELINKQSEQNTDTNELGITCNKRDVFMYEAIVDANQQGFTMAGIGDDHLQHLREPLTQAEIKTISFEEFFSPPYMKEASKK